MHISMLTISHEFLHTFVPKGGFEPPIFLVLLPSFGEPSFGFCSDKALFLLTFCVTCCRHPKVPTLP